MKLSRDTSNCPMKKKAGSKREREQREINPKEEQKQSLEENTRLES